MKIFFVILYIIIIFCIIFLERKSPTEALLWVFILICLPYVGIILYLFLGSTVPIKVTAAIRKRKLAQKYPELLTKDKVNIDTLKISDVDSQVMKFNKTYNESQLTCYDDEKFYITGKSHYEQLFKDIKDAKECIYIEFYTIHNDIMGKALVKALTEKVQQGVKVLVLCDFLANMSTPSKMYKPLRAAGGKVIRMKPFLTHYRSHRKIVVIDHKISYIGGMNIGKQYANMAKVKNPWRDTQVRLIGQCSVILDEYFLTDWLCSIRKKNCNDVLAYIGTINIEKKPLNNNYCQFIVGGADTNKESVKMCYLSMIRSAKKRIRIQSPYFIPDNSFLDALRTAAASGVEVELMIPGIKASFFLDPVTTYYVGQLLKYGIKVYKYHGYIHAKTRSIDDELCCIGSVNVDVRSMKVDDEICGVFYENNMTSEYSNIFENDILSCDAYYLNDFINRGLKEKIMEAIFLLFAPLM